MPRFVVERSLPSIGDACREEQLSMMRVESEITEKLGPENIHWIESIFTADKTYCFYDARDAETVREHSNLGGFPYDKITEIRYVLDPKALGDGDSA